MAFKVDVSVRTEVQEVVKETLNKFKVIHILVNDVRIDRDEGQSLALKEQVRLDSDE